MFVKTLHKTLVEQHSLYFHNTHVFLIICDVIAVLLFFGWFWSHLTLCQSENLQMQLHKDVKKKTITSHKSLLSLASIVRLIFKMIFPDTKAAFNISTHFHKVLWFMVHMV